MMYSTKHTDSHDLLYKQTLTLLLQFEISDESHEIQSVSCSVDYYCVSTTTIAS